MEKKFAACNEATFQAIKRLCRVIIHDVNNPLSAVSGYLQLIEMRLSKLKAGDLSVVDSLVDFHQKTQAGVERVISIIARLDQFSKIRPAPAVKVDLPSLLNRLVAGRTPEERQRIDLICPPDAVLHSLISVVEQIAFELLDNALWATREGGRVRLTVTCEGAKALLEFADEGPGIDPEMLESIFLPCYWTREKNGFPKQGLMLGMGLPIVYQLVTHLNGEIDIQSQEGKETTVRVRLPVEHA